MTLPRGSVTDGFSNTFLVGQQPSGGAGCAVPIAGAGCTVARITDGTSNTIRIGEGPTGAGCDLPVGGTGGLPTVGQNGQCPGLASSITDGTSNTIVVGSCTAATTVTTTPEPATAGLLGAGLLTVGALTARRRRRSAA